MASVVAQIQSELLREGYDIGPDGVDGVFGADTQKALRKFQSQHGLKVTGQPDVYTRNKLFPGDAPPLQSKRKSTMASWFSGIVASTAFKYLIAMVATYLAQKFGLDEGNLTAILTQLVGVAMGLWGMSSAAQNKVVSDGKVVQISDLPNKVEADVKAAVKAK